MRRAGVSKGIERKTALANDAVHLADVNYQFVSHIPGSANIPVRAIPRSNLNVPRTLPHVVHCGHTYLATLGASFFERVGYHEILVVTDGWETWITLRSSDENRVRNVWRMAPSTKKTRLSERDAALGPLGSHRKTYRLGRHVDGTPYPQYELA